MTIKNQYRITIRINGERISKYFSRKTDGDRWYLEMKRKKELNESGVEIQTESPLLKDYALGWLKTRLANGQPLSSFNQEEARLRNYILPAFGHRKLSEVLANEWESFLDKLITKNQLTNATRNRVRALLSKMYNDALRKNIVSKNPITLLPKLKESIKKWDYWGTAEETEKYLAAAQASHCCHFLFASLALNSGARIGEILALDLCDVDLVKRRIRIWRILEDASSQVQERTKGFNERWVGINDALFDAFMFYKSQTKFDDPSTPLIHRPDGTRHEHRAIRKFHIQLCHQAQVREIRIHDLRHTFASHYIMNGGSLSELQGLLGHSSPMMTLKYAHMSPGFLESRAKVVSFSTKVLHDKNDENKTAVEVKRPRTLKLV
jgi:integrase